MARVLGSQTDGSSGFAENEEVQTSLGGWLILHCTRSVLYVLVLEFVLDSFHVAFSSCAKVCLSVHCMYFLFNVAEPGNDCCP